MASAYTNSIGQYTAGGLPTGTYYAIASEDSQYVSQLYQGLPCPFEDCDPATGTAISVTVSQDTSGIDFMLARGGSIHGKITSSATGNPINYVGIDIYTATGQWAGYGYTEYNGEYSVGGLPEGSYYVRSGNWGGYVDELYNNIYCPNRHCDVLQGTAVVVTLGEDTNNIDFALDRQARIRGTVRDAVTQQPLEYVYVEIFDTNTNLVAYGYTDDYGRYTAEGLPAGSYYAKTYDAYGYQDEMYDNVPCPDGVCNWSDGTVIVLTTAATVSGIDFNLDPEDDYLYGDEFEDGELPTDWSYTKPGWSEWGGNLVGVPPAKKTAAVASPAFAGCSECIFEGTLETAGGDTAKLWMLGWYQDKKNTLELLMNETGDRWLLKQRVNGSVVQKAKAAKAIEPNTPYNVKMLYNGSQVLVFVDDMSTPLITLTPSGQPVGTAGFAVKNTTGTFGYLHIEQ
jgi:hypothetical protein